MRPDLAAAFRLLSSLPVRTHLREEPTPRPEGSAAHLTPQKIARMRELDGTMARRDICELLQVSHVTACRYLGKKRISTARKPRKE